MDDVSSELPAALVAELRDLILMGRPVAAAKRYREFTGSGVKLANGWAERYTVQILAERDAP